MGQAFLIYGGQRLEGAVEIGGSKNAAFPVLAASILINGSIKINRVPKIEDISVMIDILKNLGITVDEKENNSICLMVPEVISTEIPEELGGKIRGVLYFLGALLTKMKKVRIPLPGGCKIGKRGFSLHLDALKQMGACVNESSNYIEVSCNKLTGKYIKLPFPSRGVTGNIMMAAIHAEGITVIENADTNPEIINLGNFLIDMGVKIRGIGTKRIEIEGSKKELIPSKNEIFIPPDRIEAATMLVAGLITRGEVTVKQVAPEELSDFIDCLYRMNVQTSIKENEITVKWSENIRGSSFVTGFPPMIDPDYEPAMVSLLSIIKGIHRVEDQVNTERHQCFLPELVKMGAKINIINNTTAEIIGCDGLSGRIDLYGKDIRGAVSIVLGALSVPDHSVIYGIEQIDRGYEKLEVKLQKIGAKISRMQV